MTITISVWLVAALAAVAVIGLICTISFAILIRKLTKAEADDWLDDDNQPDTDDWLDD